MNRDQESREPHLVAKRSQGAARIGKGPLGAKAVFRGIAITTMLPVRLAGPSGKRIESDRCHLRHRCCRSNRPKLSRERVTDPTEHGLSQNRDRQDRSGPEKKRNQQQWSKINRHQSRQSRAEGKRAKDHRPRRSRRKSEPRGAELCQRLLPRTMMSQQPSQRNRRCWRAFLPSR